MADNIKRKEFSPKKPEFPAKHRGEVKSEPIYIVDDDCSARRRIGFNDSNSSDNENFEEITTTATDSIEVNNNK
jgi:hypothetical protein